MRIDVHQHLWSEPLVAALARRHTAPCIRRDGQARRLYLPAEQSCLIDVAGDEPAHRANLLAIDGVDRALIALSTALGVEGLTPDEADDLLDAYCEGAAALPEQFGAWAHAALRDVDTRRLEQLIAAGAVGLCLPSAAIASRRGLDRVGPLLETLERLGSPLFVHPGPNPWGASVHDIERRPGWWPAMTDYVASMNEAWHLFIANGRRAHPQLRVVFAMLAGGAPLHLERLAARGGPIEQVVDRDIYYDTSSYGSRMIDAMVRVVGIDQLINGSDRPVAVPFPAPGPLGDAAWRAMTEANPRRLLRRSAAAVAA